MRLVNCDDRESVGESGRMCGAVSMVADMGVLGSSVAADEKDDLLWLKVKIWESVTDRRRERVGEVGEVGRDSGENEGDGGLEDSMTSSASDCVGTGAAGMLPAECDSLTVALREDLPTFLMDRKACVARARNVLDFFIPAIPPSPPSAANSLRLTLITSTTSSSNGRFWTVPLLRMSVGLASSIAARASTSEYSQSCIMLARRGIMTVSDPVANVRRKVGARLSSC